VSNDEAPNREDARGRRTGRWEERDPHGGTIVGDYVEGERAGEWTHYFADGRVRSVSQYVAGSLTGPATWYRATGGLLQRGGFLDGEKHGFWQRWDAAGAIIDEGEFDRGSKTGRWTYFNADETVKRTTLHRGGASREDRGRSDRLPDA
jgi:antitoxin component YwqK of YwqJK toxin-antitoxin module